MEKKHSIRHTLLASTVALALFSPASHAHEGEDHLVDHHVGGIQIDGGLTWFLQSTSGLSNDVSALSLSFDLGLESRIGEHGKAVIALEGGEGLGVNDMTGGLGALSTVNYDAFVTDSTSATTGATDNISLNISQAYYEGSYYADRLTVDVGKLDVHSLFDDNAYANDETDQFFSNIFTRTAASNFTQLDRYYAPGIAANIAVGEHLDLTLIAANGNGTGFDNVLKRIYYVAQANIKASFAGYEGNYRFYTINDRRDAFTQVSDGSKTENTAWGISFDQAVPVGVGLFARYSSQDNGVLENRSETSWSAGMLVEGMHWGRDEDTIGLGYGSVNLNTKTAVLNAFKKANGITNSNDETHLELFYKLGVSDHFTLTFDWQRLDNVGGNADSGSVDVYGMRGQVNL